MSQVPHPGVLGPHSRLDHFFQVYYLISSLLSLGIFDSSSHVKSILCLLKALLFDRSPVEFSYILLQTFLINGNKVNKIFVGYGSMILMSTKI